METQSRFDLNDAINKWRAELAAHPGLTDDNLRELESHLREAVAAAVKLGSSEREAFAKALEQIGASTQLASEFSRENTGLIWRQRLFWMALAAAVLPVLLNLPLFVLALAERWLQQAGYSDFARALNGATSGPVNWIVPPALAIGLLALLNRGRRLPLRECIAWLMDRSRLLVVLVAPTVLWLLLYAHTERSGTFLQWLGGLALGLMLAIGIMALPDRFGATGIRRVLSWLIAGRIRLGVFLGLLVLAPTISNMVGVYLTLNLIGGMAGWLKLQAGFYTSMAAFELLLFGIVIAFQPSAAPACQPDAANDTCLAPRSLVRDRHWRQWSIWMCAGCLLLVAWGVIQTGLNELMIRGIDQWWARALIGIGLPLAVAAWVWRPGKSTPRVVVIKGAQTVSSSGLKILNVALLIALLGVGVNWLALETAMQFSGSGVTSLLVGFQAQAWGYMMNQIWPTALLGLLLGQLTRHRDHPEEA